MDAKEQKKPPLGSLKKRPLIKTYSQVIQEGLSKLQGEDDCLELKVIEYDTGKTVTQFAVYIGTIAYNYKKKTGHNGFTVRIIDDETLGVWIKQ